MRIVYLVILFVLVLAVVLFAVQNQTAISIRFMEWALTYPLSVVIAAVYLIGMISGSTVVGVLRRTVRGVAESDEE